MNAIKSILARCDQGWTLPQKCGLTFLLLIYWLSPIDLIPDPLLVLGQCDDLFMTYCIFRVWNSPTLGARQA